MSDQRVENNSSELLKKKKEALLQQQKNFKQTFKLPDIFKYFDDKNNTEEFRKKIEKNSDITDYFNYGFVEET